MDVRIANAAAVEIERMIEQRALPSFVAFNFPRNSANSDTWNVLIFDMRSILAGSLP